MLLRCLGQKSLFGCLLTESSIIRKLSSLKYSTGTSAGDSNIGGRVEGQGCFDRSTKEVVAKLARVASSPKKCSCQGT
jgi:hypothetical protein